MAITQQQIDAAKQVQDAAAQDTRDAVRLVAGPGTGKSFVIEGRVHWLLASQNVAPGRIIAVSFTRAASKDLRDRIYSFCLKNGQNNVTDVRVSTLHSLALRILSQTGNLTMYPTNPAILDDWEMKCIFDAEFAIRANRTGGRAEEIRFDHEAFWSTGAWNPPNLPPIDEPITQEERDAFSAYYRERTQTYSCVIPGEVIRTCVDQIKAGVIDPTEVLGVEHLIVDEAQDLNACDNEFIDLLKASGAKVFMSGDDDQSIYSFRYAFPEGIQSFTARYAGAGDHVLNDCFRCTPSVLTAAQNVIRNYPAPNRIPKALSSVYTNSTPANAGFIQANRFPHAQYEELYIANSCRELINSGIAPQDIMVLIGNKRALLRGISSALDAVGVGYEGGKQENFKDGDHGRFLLGLLRIIEDTNDYIAHRLVLGTPQGVGHGTCNKIAEKVFQGNRNYHDLFYTPLPAGVFDTRETKAITKCVGNITAIQGWQIGDTLAGRSAEISQLLRTNFSAEEAAEWDSISADLPPDMLIGELKDFIQADTHEIRENIVRSVSKRLNPDQAAEQGEAAAPGGKVRLMTFHSSKGLSAKIVFIPGLEELIFPTARTAAITGLVFENARLLYVAITRAKAACILSYAQVRQLRGRAERMTASRFCVATGVTFVQQNNQVVQPNEIQAILTAINDL